MAARAVLPPVRLGIHSAARASFECLLVRLASLHSLSLKSSTPSVKRLAQTKKKGVRTSQSGASIVIDEPVDGVQGLGTAASTATKVADVQGPDTADSTATKVADVQGHNSALNTSAQPVDVLQAPPPVQEDLKSPEDCTELNNLNYHPSMRDVIITGAEDVIIPVSTLDVFAGVLTCLRNSLTT